MLPFDEYADAGDANTPDMASTATPAMQDIKPVVSDTNDGDATDDTTVVALVDDIEFTLTVAQVLERFVSSGRQAPSARSIQRYCIEGRLVAKKIRTIFGAEWLINEASLARLIEQEAVVTNDAGDANTPDMASTATPAMQDIKPVVSDTNDGDATDKLAALRPIHETRTIAEVLIENARLLAQVEGRDAIIAELKEDRSFLREEVREGRRTRDDVKSIAESMLDALKTMAAGRLPSSTNSQGTVRTVVIEPDDRQQEGRG